MAENFENIPSIARLALQYGTITEGQFSHLNRLYALVAKEKREPDYGELLLGQKMATPYQIDLLKLIREYHIIRRKGEEFGKIAVKKGFATPNDIRHALEIQKKEFKESRLKKLMGDILVADGVITVKQKDQILKEQTLFDKKSKEILVRTRTAHSKEDDNSNLHLSGYEQEFLRIKALDEEFSAAVVEKGLASEREVVQAKEIQEEAFEQKKTIKILGDIMVALEFITPEQRNIILAEQGRTEEISAREIKPVISLSVSGDAMTAWIEIDRDKGATPEFGDIKSLLKSKKVIKGCFPDALIQCCLDYGLSRFAVARNDYSAELRDARHLKLNFDKDLTDKGEKRKGELLAHQDSRRNIGQKKNIYNKTSAAVSDLDFTIRCGSGTRLSRDKSGIIASKTGVPALSVERFVYIHPIIHVLEDADQRYGPLEDYANMTVSGTITGAYPVTAGTIMAREIRGATIDAIGDIRTDVGITDALIRTQGDVHARYLHNCRIETFGTVYVKNEIFDSDIRCSGMVNSPDCRVIASEIHAKNGVILAGTGSEKTEPCKITAGGEHHILVLIASFLNEIETATKALTDLEEERREEKNQAKRIFQKMVELKIFHDRAQQKKERLVSEFKKKKAGLDKGQLKNILKLISNFEKRMEKSILRLKDLNKIKKAHDQAAAKLKNRIQALTPATIKKRLELEKSIFACLEWSRSRTNSPVIEIRGKAFQGTTFGGVYSSIRMDSHMEYFSVEEITPEENEVPFMKILPELSKKTGKLSGA